MSVCECVSGGHVCMSVCECVSGGNVYTTTTLITLCTNTTHVALCTTITTTLAALYAHNTKHTKVRQCRPQLRRDQIATGLSTIDGVDPKAARMLASHIPVKIYNTGATIEAVIQYCCSNYCRDCKGARLHDNVDIKDQDGKLCEWRMSKRRKRGQDGKFVQHNWLSRCVGCSLLQQGRDRKSNDRAKARRHRVKKDMSDYLCSGKKVKVNSLDKITWLKFAQLRKQIATAKREGDNYDLFEELRKIAVQVLHRFVCTCTCMPIIHVCAYVR